MQDDPTTDNNSGLPSYSGSMKTYSPAQAYRRIRRVLALQWRGIALVLILITLVVYFAVVFIELDSSSRLTAANLTRAKPWLACLIATEGDKNKCLPEARKFIASDTAVFAVLILLSLVGFFYVILIGHWSMVLGWINLFQRKFSKGGEFVSVDARRYSKDPRTYEMLATTPQPVIKTPDPLVLSPESEASTWDKGGVRETDYFGTQGQSKHPAGKGSFSNSNLPYGTPQSPSQKAIYSPEARVYSPEARVYSPDARVYSPDARVYTPPQRSFSHARAPSMGTFREWDPRETHAPGSISPPSRTFSQSSRRM